jgi:hypothetical protein
MAITTTIVRTQWTDGGPSTSQGFVIQWRVVSDIALSLTQASSAKSIRDGTCGEPGDPIPGTTFSTSSITTTLRLRAFQIDPVLGSKGYVFDVTATYSSEYTWANISGGGGADKLVLPVTVDMEAGERTMQAWRTASSLGAFAVAPSYIYGKSLNIGGTGIDDAGKPTQVRVPTMDVRISMVQDTSNTAAGTLVAVYDKINTVQGKWNNNTFLHWGAYEVFCTSATVTNIRDEYYRVTYNFRWDYWRDCNQVPEYDTNGLPIIDGSTKKAKFVFWTGLNRGNADLNVIFNTNTDAVLAKQMALEGTYLTYP